MFDGAAAAFDGAEGHPIQDDPDDIWFHFSVANDPGLDYAVEIGDDPAALGPGSPGVDHELEAFPSPSGEALDIWVRPLGDPDRFFLRYGVQ